MTQPTDKVREAFEALYPNRDLTQDLDGTYVALSTRMHFKDFATVWQASRTAALNEAYSICEAEEINQDTVGGKRAAAACVNQLLKLRLRDGK